jgi:hypothetical protein
MPFHGELMFNVGEFGLGNGIPWTSFERPLELR